MSGGSWRIGRITPDATALYGTIVDWSAALDESRSFHILVRSEQPTGWRLAALKVGVHEATSLENHPTTWELFAPLASSAVLLLAPAGIFREETVRAFLLDRPLCLKPGVWHGVVTLSEAATILIAENLEVSSERAVLSQAVGF